MKLKMFRQILEKYSNTEFHENPSSGGRADPCGRTDKHDEANTRLFEILRKRLITNRTVTDLYLLLVSTCRYTETVQDMTSHHTLSIYFAKQIL